MLDWAGLDREGGREGGEGGTCYQDRVHMRVGVCTVLGVCVCVSVGRVPPLARVNTHTPTPTVARTHTITRPPAAHSKKALPPSSSPIQISHPNSPIQSASRVHLTTQNALFGEYLGHALHRRQPQVTRFTSFDRNIVSLRCTRFFFATLSIGFLVLFSFQFCLKNAVHRASSFFARPF